MRLFIERFISKGIFLPVAVLVFLGCHAQERKLTLRVDTNFEDHVETVSVIGNLKPLNQKGGFALKDEDNDGIYEASVQLNTDSRYVKFKFMMNDETELQGSSERILWFKDKGPTIGNYVFNEYTYYDASQIKKLAYTDSEIDADISILRQILLYVHPNIYQFRDSITLEDDFKHLAEEMKAEPGIINAYGAISRLAAKIKCSHTFTNPWNQGPDIKRALFYQPDKIPFTFKRIEKRLFVDKNASQNELLKTGLEILTINGITTAEVMTKLSEYVTSDGSNLEKKLNRLTVTGTEKFELFDIFYPIAFGSPSEFVLQMKDTQTGEIIEAKVDAISKTKRTKVLMERYDDLVTNIEDLLDFEVLDKNTAKLTMKSFAIHNNELDWKAFLKNTFEKINEKGVSNLIIDIRNNEGGDTDIGLRTLEYVLLKPMKIRAMENTVRYIKIPEEFKQYISTWDNLPYDFTGKFEREENGRFFLKDKYSVKEKIYKPKKEGFKGQVFLIIDSANSSATHIMASYARQFENITLVGQETGGNQLGVNAGIIFFLRLPNTRIELDIPVVAQFVPTDQPAKDSGIKPDIKVDKNVQDWMNGEDTEVNTILELINKG